MNDSVFTPFTAAAREMRAVHQGGTEKKVFFLGVALGRAYVKWPMDTPLLVRPRDGSFLRASCKAWRIHPDDLRDIRDEVEKDKRERRESLGSPQARQKVDETK